MSSTEHTTPLAPAEPFDPTRMNAQTAQLMASDMAALAGAMFRLLQPQAVAQPASAPETPAPAAPTPAAPPPALPVQAIAVPALDLQPTAPAEPGPGIPVPAIAVPGLAVPGVRPEDEVDQVSAPAQEPALPDAEEHDAISPRSRALMNEIAFLDD